MAGDTTNGEQDASELIDQQIAEANDWRGERLARVRTVINVSLPNVVEKIKWMQPSKPLGMAMCEANDLILAAADHNADGLALVTQGSIQAAIFSSDDLEASFDKLVESVAEVSEEPPDQPAITQGTGRACRSVHAILEEREVAKRKRRLSWLL